MTRTALGSFDLDGLGPPTAAQGGRDAATFPLALLLAVALHVAVMMLVSLDQPRDRLDPVPESALDVIILRDAAIASVGTPSPDAALSQRDHRGQSASSDLALSSPEPAPPDAVLRAVEDPIESLTSDVPIVEAVARPPETEERVTMPAEPEPILSQSPPTADPVTAMAATPEQMPTLEPIQPSDVLTAREPEPEPEVVPKPLERPAPAVDAAQILASRGAELERLTASLQAKSTAYASLARRKSVSANTREFRYASYLSAWARKVERIGNLNYPQAAREQRMFGSLILHVAVRADGSVEQIRIVRSSGYDLLDEAAIRIVELAAPFAPFPADIAAETDVLDIVRTWQFLQGGRLGWEQ